jgi:hypothetical protein
MVTFTCNVKECANENVEYNYLGNPEFAECGGCKAILEAKDLREDPQLPTE